MPPSHAAAFAALSLLLLLGLGLRTSQLRVRHGIYAGFGGNEQLRRASRAHGLSIEHLLPMLLSLLCLELLGADRRLIDGLGALMLLGRLLHVAGLLGGRPEVALRRGGMGITYAIELLLALLLLTKAFGAW